MPTVSKKTVFLIDDDSSIRKVYTAKFSLHPDFTIQSAINGKEGLDKLQEFIPDLILLDVMMPKMDGFEVLEKIKKNAAFKKIPVIMLTNLENATDKAEAIKRGADCYFVKAFYTPQEVVKKVEDLLKKKAVI